MENIGDILITISGTKGTLPVQPDNYDIKEVQQILEQAENMLIPGDKTNRPTISYRLEEGSVRHVFKTTMQYVIGFNAILGQVNQERSLDFLDLPTAKAFETLQQIAQTKNYTLAIETSLPMSHKMELNKDTRLMRTASVWVNADFYFYGKITNMGGKERANMHLSTPDAGTLIIQTPKEYLEKLENNLLYKTYGIHAVGKQHSETGEIDKSSLRFANLVEYNSDYNIDYLNTLRNKAQKSWKDTPNTTEWLRNLRGGYDA